MKTVSMPAAFALAAIAEGVPPLERLVYQIHMPSPSNGLPCGAAGSGALIGGGTTGAGSCLAVAA